MSSFICSAKHFNSIEIAVRRLFNSPHYSPCYKIRELLKDKEINESFDIKSREFIKGLIDELRKLNVICVTLQYERHAEGKLNQEIEDQMKIVFSNSEGFKELSKVGLYNALRCVRYQIEEDYLDDFGDYI
jgi:hypothetical protein